MVDSGITPSDSVIDITTRRRKVENPPPDQPVELPDAGNGGLLSLSFLIERLFSQNTQVKMWAAFQLVDRWQEHCEAYIGYLWPSPQEEIRESAVTLAGKYNLMSYAFPLMRLFKAKEGALSHAAGVELGKMGYEPAARLLERWFFEAVGNPDTNPLELEAATEAMLLINPNSNWDLVFEEIGKCLQNHSFYSILFRLLCRNAKTPGQMKKLAEGYGEVRETFNDFHLTVNLEEVIGRNNLTRYFQARLNGGFRLNAIYQECLRILGLDETEAEVRDLLDALAGCRNTKNGMERYFALCGELLTGLRAKGEVAERIAGFLQGCRSWVSSWDHAILKVREIEYHLILSLPLVALLSQVEEKCLADPEAEALRITRIYQSPLLSPDFMGRVLTLISENGGRPAMAGIHKIPITGWVRDEEKDALWKMFTNQLDDVDYPLEKVLPQPWLYPIPTTLERLVKLLEKRLPGYLESERHQAIDYCLEIFRRAGGDPEIERLLEHFDFFINHNFHAFLELMTHLPDVRFLQPLVNHYRDGESDLLRLIYFICDVHRLPYPNIEKATTVADGESGDAGWMRLQCRACGGSYQYAPQEFYVDEECIEQRQIPSHKDVWTPQRFECKKCGSPVPFLPDDRFLSDLFAELLAARLFPQEERQSKALGHIHLIGFPRLEGKRLNPAHFLTEVERVLENSSSPTQEKVLLLELGRFRMEINQMEPAKQTFQKILAGPCKCPEALYFLGVIAFQEKNLYEARVHFSRLIQGSVREDFDQELDNPVDMAHHYLKLLDKREFKRSHFHLISS